MLSYVTEIDFRQNEVRTKFLGETNTFCFLESIDSRVRLEDALKISAEFMHGRLKEFFAGLVEHAEKVRTGEAGIEGLLKLALTKRRINYWVRHPDGYQTGHGTESGQSTSTG